MRNVIWFIAAIFCLVAIAGQWSGLPREIAGAALVLAAAFLGWGFYDKASKQEPKPIVLDEEQRATIKRMKEEGNHQLAIQQVQMWFRNPPAEEAARIVREV